MSNIVTFESTAVPAFLQQRQSTAINNELASLATGFPTVSIKGKVFAIVRDGERKVMTRPDDPTAPLSAINCVIVNASGKVKTYYDKAFSEDAEDKKPVCFSNDGKHPDPTIDHPQCTSCTMCPHNVFGTAISENGGFGKGKACSDAVRLAIFEGNDTYLLRVPPASLRNLGRYVKTLNSKGVPYNAVYTKIAFDIEAAAPQLTFTFAGFLNEAQYRKISELAETDQVMAIIGRDQATIAQAPAAPHEAPVAAPAPKPVEKAVQAAPAPTPAPKPQPVQTPVAQAESPLDTEAPVGDDELKALFDDVPF